MNPVYYGMVPDGQFHSGIPLYPTHAEFEVAPVPQPATYYTGQNVLYQQVQQVPVPQQFGYPSAPLHYQHTPGNVSQYIVQHRASPSPPQRTVDRLKLSRHPVPIASPPLPARIVQYNPSVPPPYSKAGEEITGPVSDNTGRTKVDDKTDFRRLALHHGIDVRSPLDNTDTNSQAESNKMNQKSPENITVKSYVKQQVLKEFDSIYGSNADIKENQPENKNFMDSINDGNRVLGKNNDSFVDPAHVVYANDDDAVYQQTEGKNIDEMSDEDSFEIEIEEHEILSGHYESSSWTESHSESDEEEVVVRVVDSITRDNTDSLEEHETSEVNESIIKSDPLPMEELASAIVKEAVSEAVRILSNTSKTHNDGGNVNEEFIHYTDGQQNVSNNCSRDIRNDSQTEGKTRLYSWTYTEIHTKHQQKTDTMTDVVDESIPEPDFKAEVSENVMKEEEEKIPRNSSQGTSHCDLAISGNDKICGTKYDEKETWLSDTHTHKIPQRSCIEESNADSCQSFDLKMIFKHKDLWRSQSEGSESDKQSLEGSQSDPVEAFKMKASKRGIKIMDLGEKFDSVTDSDADSDLKAVNISRSNTIESVEFDLNPDPISRSSTIESLTDYSISAPHQGVNRLNPDVPEFRLDHPLETNLMKLEGVPDTLTVSKNLTLNPDCAIFQPRYEKQNSDSLQSQKLGDQSFRNYDPSQPWDTNMRADAPVFVPGGKKDISDSAQEVTDIKKPKAGIFYLPTPEQPPDEVDLSVAVQASPTVTSIAVGTKRVKLKDSIMCTSACETREVAINTEGREEIGLGPVVLTRKPKAVSRSTSTKDVFKRSVGLNVKMKDPAKIIEKKDSSTMVKLSCYEPDTDIRELLEKVKSLQLDLMKYKEKEVVDQLVKQKDTLEKQSEVLVAFFKDSDDLDVIKGLIRNKISTIEKTIAMVEEESLRTTLKINSGKTLDVLPDLKKHLAQNEELQQTSSFNSAVYAVTSPIKASLSQASTQSSKAGCLSESPERMVFPIKGSPRQVSRLSSAAGSSTEILEMATFSFKATPSQTNRLSSEVSPHQANRRSSEARSLAGNPERMAFPFKASPRLSSEARRLAESPNRNSPISSDGQRHTPGNASHIPVSPFPSPSFELRQTQETIKGAACLSSKLSSPSSTRHTSPLRLPAEPEYIPNIPQLNTEQIEEDSDLNFQISQSDKQINRIELKTKEEKELCNHTKTDDSEQETDIGKDLISKLMKAEYSKSRKRVASNESESALKSMDSTESDKEIMTKDLGKDGTDGHESLGAEMISHNKITELDTFDIISDGNEEMVADEVLYNDSLVQTESQNFVENISHNRVSELDTFDVVSGDSDKIDADDVMQTNKQQNLLVKISHNTVSKLDAFDTISDDSDKISDDEVDNVGRLELDESQSVLVKNIGDINKLKYCELDTDAEKYTQRGVSSDGENTDVNEDSVNKNENEVKLEDTETESTPLPDKQAEGIFSRSGRACPSVDTKKISMSTSSTSEDIQHPDSNMKLTSVVSKEITGSVGSPRPTVGHFDPMLFQAVMGQLIHAYPHLASNQTVLTSIAMQQTQLLQMYMRGQQAEDVGQSTAPRPNFINTPVGISAMSPNTTLAADFRSQSAIHLVNNLSHDKVIQNDKPVPVMSADRSNSATTDCNSPVLPTSNSPIPKTSVRNIIMSQDPSQSDKENVDNYHATAMLKSSPSLHIKPSGISNDLTGGADLPKCSVNNNVASSDMYSKIHHAEETMSIYQNEVYRPKISKLGTLGKDSTQTPLSDVGMKTDGFNISHTEHDKDHKDFFPKFTGKKNKYNKERVITMTHQDQQVINKTKMSDANNTTWRTPNPPECDEHDGNFPSKRFDSIQSEKQYITKSKRSIVANFNWGMPGPPAHDKHNGSFPCKKFGSSVQPEKQEMAKKDPKMTDIPPRFRRQSQEENEELQIYVPPHLRGPIAKDNSPTWIPSTEDWDTEAENISEICAAKMIPAAKHGMKRKQDPSFEEKEDAKEKMDRTKETSAGGKSEMCDIPIPKVPKVDDSKEATDGEEEKEEWCMVTTKRKKSQVKDQLIKQVPSGNSSTQPQKLSNFERLVCRLQEEFPESNRQAIIDAVTKVRKQRGSLSGLSVENIIERAQFFIDKKANRYIPGLHFTQSSSGPKNIMNIPQMKPDPIVKNVPVLSEDDEDICVICHEALSAMETKELECLHTYHYKCISQWVERERTCPTCRQHALFPEDFPRLGK